jgi:L,D-transpeptidase-like protein
LKNQSDALFEFLTSIVFVLVGVTIIWYLIIFENPQVTLNPFKPPLATPVELAGILPPTEMPSATSTPWASPSLTPIATLAATSLPSPSAAAPTITAASRSLTPFDFSSLPQVIAPQPSATLRTVGLNFVQPNPPTDGKWIDVNLSEQTTTAYLGSTSLKTVLVSTGVASHPTIVGQFKIYVKIQSQAMSGGNRFSHDYYYLPGVPDIMFFYDGYAIHGTYWHNNFGHPMSHGCVNLSLEDAKWFYNWAEVGTTVVVHA